MTFAAQVGADLLLVDGLEPATIERTDGSTPTPVAHALRRATGTVEADASGGKYTASDTVWHLLVAELAAGPRLGDRVVDALGIAWTVLEVESQTFGGRWRCRTRNLAIVPGLDQQVTIQRATWSQAGDGAPVAVWGDWRLNVAARVHPLIGSTVEAESRTQTRRRLQVYLAEPLTLDHNCRIVHGTTVYRVLGCERSEALEQLLTVLVEPVAAAGV